MTISHESRLRVIDYWDHVDSTGISSVHDEATYEYEMLLEDGTGNSQAREMFHVRATVSGNDDDSYDLAGGVTDVFGNTITFSTIKEILVYNRSDEATDYLLIGGLDTPTGGNLITDLFDGDTDSRIKVYGSGVFLVTAPLTGYTVTGGSADVLLISNEGADAITYDLIVKGT